MDSYVLPIVVIHFNIYWLTILLYNCNVCRLTGLYANEFRHSPNLVLLPLLVTVTSKFSWLLPKLAMFSTVYPQLTLVISVLANLGSHHLLWVGAVELWKWGRIVFLHMGRAGRGGGVGQYILLYLQGSKYMLAIAAIWSYFIRKNYFSPPCSKYIAWFDLTICCPVAFVVHTVFNIDLYDYHIHATTYLNYSKA